MPAKYITVAGDGVTRMCILPYRFEKRKARVGESATDKGKKCMMIEMGKRLDEKEILDETERGKAVSAPAGARPQTPPSDYSMIHKGPNNGLGSRLGAVVNRISCKRT